MKPPPFAAFKKRAKALRFHSAGLTNAGLEKTLHTEFSIELFNTTTGIDKLLLACIEGVTFGTNLNRYVLPSGACLYNLAASTPDGCLVVLGMDTFLHYVHLFHEFSFKTQVVF